jgi:hypothetical protein
MAIVPPMSSNAQVESASMPRWPVTEKMIAVMPLMKLAVQNTTAKVAIHIPTTVAASIYALMSKMDTIVSFSLCFTGKRENQAKSKGLGLLGLCLIFSFASSIGIYFY